MVAGLTAEHRAGPGALPAAQSHLCCRPTSDTSARACPLGTHTHFFSPFILIEVPTPPSRCSRGLPRLHQLQESVFLLASLSKSAPGRVEPGPHCTPAWGLRPLSVLNPVPCLRSRERPERSRCPSGDPVPDSPQPIWSEALAAQQPRHQEGLVQTQPWVCGPHPGCF